MNLKTFNIYICVFIICFAVNVCRAFGTPVGLSRQSYLSPEIALSEAALQKMFLQYGININISYKDALKERVDDIVAELIYKEKDQLEKQIPSAFEWEKYADTLRNELFSIMNRYVEDRFRRGLPIDKNNSTLRDFIRNALNGSFNMATGFFRDGGDMELFEIKGWVSEVEDFFDELIAEKTASNDFKIRIKAIGGANGREAYSIAAILHSRLSAYALKNGLGKSWTEKWDVAIENYDISLNLLLQSKMGIYQISREDGEELKKKFEKYVPYFNIRSEKEFLVTVELPEILKSWIKPIYADFDYDNFKSKEDVAAYLARDSRANFIVSMNFFPYVKPILMEIEGGIFNSFDRNNTHSWLENEDLNHRPVFHGFASDSVNSLINDVKPLVKTLKLLGGEEVIILNSAI